MASKVLKKLMPRHLRIVDLFVEGLTPTQISRIVGLTVTQIQNIRNSPNFQHEFDRRRTIYEEQMNRHLIADQHQTAKDIIQKNQVAAANVLVDLLKSPDPSVGLRSAESLLDRGGNARLLKHHNENRSVVMTLDAESLANLKASLELDSD